MNLSDFGGTKFIVTMCTCGATTLLVAFHLIDAATYMTVTLGIVGGFFAANTTEGIKSRTNDAKVAIANATPVPIAPQ